MEKTMGKKVKSISKEEKKNHYMTRVNTVQLIVCATLFLLLILLKFTGSASFESLREILCGKAEETFSFEVAIESIKQFTSSIAKAVMTPVDAFNNDGEEAKASDEPKTGAYSASLLLAAGGDQEEKILILQAYNPPPTSSSFSPYYVTVPAVVPVSGKVTSKYGYRRDPFTKETSFHKGTDIAVSEGTRVMAAYSGIVKEIGSSDTGYGNYVILEHEGNLETLYAHCQKILVPKGAVINAGEVIALSGNTGRSTGPHLHFEIRIGGVRYDPASVLKLK